MKVATVKLQNFKRFTNLTIRDIPASAKLVIIVGPNGSGKSSLFDAFNTWYRSKSGFGAPGDENYYRKDPTKAYSRGGNVVVQFHDHEDGRQVSKKSMYFRTAYRNDPDFNISSFGRMGAPHEQLKVSRFIDNDQTVSENYQRLVHATMAGVYSEDNDDMSVRALREELIGKVRQSMLNVFDDLVLNNIGDPLGDGSFHFKKGQVASYHYKNLSGGEKSAFDLLLDLNLKLDHYDDTVFFIDEPETHMHTGLQGNLIKEMHRIVPENSQMWITTHSLGVMRMAKTLSKEEPGSVVFIDFGEIDFDDEAVIGPASISGLMWEKFLSVALDDFSRDLNPEVLVMCEGNINGRKRKNFDSFLYGKIFSSKYPNVTFVSGGSCTEIEDTDHVGFRLLSEVLKGTKMARLIDRDDKSDEEVAELEAEGVFVTSRRHIEAYLFDDELIERLVIDKYRPDLLEEEGFDSDEEKRQELVRRAFEVKRSAMNNSVGRGRPTDDVKAASGDIYVGLKTLLNLTRCGNNADMFMRDVMSEYLCEDTNTFKELDEDVLAKILNA
ncbi:ATP-binding protein [Billgrantia pellis]|uniref:ATP-binding protein n=1 Tax=Billgrantia pellis TaxID=2606936 RepID=A0A7V7KIS7_9GAMM|nr:AAA family ATPase [Halomonas pellis]KAA0012980.1 ATP-binding protein [Halomonas pellis]